MQKEGKHLTQRSFGPVALRDTWLELIKSHGKAGLSQANPHSDRTHGKINVFYF